MKFSHADATMYQFKLDAFDAYLFEKSVDWNWSLNVQVQKCLLYQNTDLFSEVVDNQTIEYERKLGTDLDATFFKFLVFV